MKVNLLPWREQRLKKMAYQFLITIVVSLVAVINITLFITHHIIIQKNLAIFHYSQQKSRLTSEQIQLLKKIQAERKNFFPQLLAINETLPQTCYLTKLAYHKQWQIQGYAPSMQLINEFAMNLKHHQEFHEVILDNVTQKQQFFFIIHGL